MKLLGLLFDNNSFDNIISANDPKTVEGYNNMAIILLALFVP